METKYLITVEWCNNGKRGIFCSNDGLGYGQSVQHTKTEMSNILGLFSLILSPKSEQFTEDDVKNYNRFVPLAEYNNIYGIALRSDINQHTS